MTVSYGCCAVPDDELHVSDLRSVEVLREEEEEEEEKKKKKKKKKKEEEKRVYV
jgi:hypothetical protein